MQSSHQWMCGWARGPAGWLGDCTSYAKKPTQVVVTGPVVPQTKGDLYRFGLKRFVESIDQDDKEEFDKLFAEGWRMQTKDACNLVLWKKITPSFVVALERFAREKIVCSAMEGPAYVLSSIDGCLRDGDFGSNGKLAAIDRWIALRPSPDLKNAASMMSKAYNTARTATLDEIAQLCLRTYYGEDGRRPTGAEAEFITTVFRASKACRSDSKMNYGGSYIGFMSHYHGNYSNRNDQLELCRSLVKESGLDPKAAPFKVFLDRWSRGG